MINISINSVLIHWRKIECDSCVVLWLCGRVGVETWGALAWVCLCGCVGVGVWVLERAWAYACVCLCVGVFLFNFLILIFFKCVFIFDYYVY